MSSHQPRHPQSSSFDHSAVFVFILSLRLMLRRTGFLGLASELRLLHSCFQTSLTYSFLSQVVRRLESPFFDPQVVQVVLTTSRACLELHLSSLVSVVLTLGRSLRRQRATKNPCPDGLENRYPLTLRISRLAVFAVFTRFFKLAEEDHQVLSYKFWFIKHPFSSLNFKQHGGQGSSWASLA